MTCTTIESFFQAFQCCCIIVFKKKKKLFSFSFFFFLLFFFWFSSESFYFSFDFIRSYLIQYVSFILVKSPKLMNRLWKPNMICDLNRNMTKTKTKKKQSNLMKVKGRNKRKNTINNQDTLFILLSTAFKSLSTIVERSWRQFVIFMYRFVLSNTSCFLLLIAITTQILKS